MTSLIAMLLSFAMMLTGAASEGMPAQSARTLTLRNVVVTLNGDTQRLAPEAHIGVMSDGESAVFNFGIDADDKTLLPIQLGVSEKGLTALFEASGAVVNLTKEALDSAMLQSSENLSAMNLSAENPELMNFLTQEYIPAYVGLMQAAADKDFQADIQAKGDALLDSVVDRGEATPGTVEIDGTSYDVLAYHYVIDGPQMGALADAVFASAPELTAYSDAMFKLYSMMPAESGLNEVKSFTDLMTNFGIDMTMDMNEQRTEDGQVRVTDAVMTMDLNGVAEKLNDQMQAQALPVEDAEGEPVEGEPAPTPVPVELPPMVMNIHGETVNGANSANVAFAYGIAGNAMDFEMNVVQADASTSAELNGEISTNGEKVGRLSMSSIAAENEEGGTSYGYSASIVSKDAIQMDISVYGDMAQDGASYNTVSLDGRTKDTSFGLSFDVQISTDAFEDKVNAAEPAVVIDDLSNEAMSSLFQDQDIANLMTKVGASLSADAALLTQEQSIRNVATMLSGERLPIEVEDEPEADYDYTYEIDGDDGIVIDGLDDGEYEEAEDDGELGFDVPELTFLPVGWSVSNVETDTAYDWVGITVTDADGAENLYVTFFQDMDGELTNYTVADDGTVQQARAMTVSDYGEGGMNVVIRENGIYGSLSFAPDTVDVDAIGQIVAGIQY